MLRKKTENNIFSLAVTTDGTCFDIIWLHDYQARHRARTAKCDSGIMFFIRGFASKRHLFISPHESPCWAELGSQSLALRWDLLAKTNNHLVFRIWFKICSDEVVPEDAISLPLQSLCGCRKKVRKVSVREALRGKHYDSINGKFSSKMDLPSSSLSLSNVDIIWIAGIIGMDYVGERVCCVIWA